MCSYQLQQQQELWRPLTAVAEILTNSGPRSGPVESTSESEFASAAVR